MTPPIAVFLLAILGAATAPQDKPAPARSALKGQREFTVEQGLKAVEKVRTDGFRSLNHLLTHGEDTTAVRITKERLEKFPGSQARHYERAFDQYARSMDELSATLGKILPTEPIAPDARKLFGDSSLPESAVRSRKQQWIVGRLKDFDPAWDTARSGIRDMATTLWMEDKSFYGDADYARGWREAPAERSSPRELEAAEMSKKLRDAYERRLSKYWDEAREAWISSEGSK